jgi:uncharacterized protein YqeY
MNLESKVQTALTEAMRSRNEGALRALRAVKSAILLAKTGGGSAAGGLKSEDEIKLLQKLVKQRRESLDIYRREGRDDLASAEQEELDVIEKFLPKAMDDSEVEAVVKKIIAETGASSPADLGKVMGAAVKALAGKADNKKVSEMVRRLLG